MEWAVTMLMLELKCSLLLGAAFLLLLLFRRFSASQRHLVLTLAMIGGLLVPATHFCLPHWETPLLPDVEISRSGSVPGAEPILAYDPSGYDELPSVEADGTALVGTDDGLAAGTGMPLSQIALLVWVGGVACLLLPLVIGHVAALRIVRRAAPVRGSWKATRERVLDRFPVRRGIAVLECPDRQMPMAFGVLKPTIILPADGREWTERERESVLVHELAHVKRYDCLIHLVCSIVTALHWFNPLFWFAMRRMRLEREHACDDFVLSHGSEAPAYADQLLEVARMQPCRLPLFGAAITMARKSALEGRLLAILDDGRKRSALGIGTVCVAILVLVGLALPLASATGTKANEEIVLADGETVGVSGVPSAESIASEANIAGSNTVASGASAQGDVDAANPFLGGWVVVDAAAYSPGKLHLLIEDNSQALLYGGDMRKRMQWSLNYDELVLNVGDGMRTANLTAEGLLIYRKGGRAIMSFRRRTENDERPEEALPALHHGPRPDAKQIRKQLLERLRIAKGISSFSERDDVLAEIAVDAGRLGNVEVALTALRAISSFSTRDAAASRCADRFIELGLSAEAANVAGTISSFSTRDEVLARIAQGRTAATIDPSTSESPGTGDHSWRFHYSTDTPLDAAQIAEMKKQVEQMKKQMETMMESGAMDAQMKIMQQQMETMSRFLENQ